MALDLLPAGDPRCDSCAGKQRRGTMCERCFKKFADEMTAEVMQVNERYFDPVGGYRWSRTSKASGQELGEPSP